MSLRAMCASTRARKRSGRSRERNPHSRAGPAASHSRHGRRLKATLRTLPSPMTDLPRLPEPPFRRAVVDCFPARAAFPKWQEGRHPHCHFRGPLRLHSRYGPPDCSAAQGDLCREAPAQPVTQPSCSSASGPIDNYPVRSSLTDSSRLRGALPTGDIRRQCERFMHAAAVLRAKRNGPEGPSNLRSQQ